MHYLVEFNNVINGAVKTHGLSLNNDGSFRIDYVDEPTESQINEVNKLVASYPMFCKRLEKIAAIDNEFSQAISSGWNSGRGILGLSADDVALLSGLYALAKESANLGYPIPPIITQDDQEITFSDIQSMTVFMLQYGGYRSSISQTFASRRRAVNVATTIEQIEGA